MLELINEKKRLVLMLFLFGLVMGTLIANYLSNDVLSQISILNLVFFEQYAGMNVDYAKLFQIVAVNRLIPLIVMMVCGTTGIGLWLIGASIIYFGFVAGFIISASVIKFGMIGILLNVVYQFPHLLVYAIGCTLLYFKLYRMAQEKREHGDERNSAGSYMMVCVIVIGIFLLGICLETFVNPGVLKAFIRGFMTY